MRLRAIVLIVALGVAFVGVTGCVGSGSLAAGPTNLPAESDVPLAAKTVWAGTYGHDIQPVFDQYCISCHGPNRAENGLRLDSYQSAMKGTQYGPVVVPGSPSQSTLVSVIAGTADPRIRMPHEGQRLTRNRMQNIVLWIEAGAPSN